MDVESKILDETIDLFLAEVSSQLVNQVVIDKSFEDIAPLIPTYVSDSALHQEDIEYFAKKLADHSLRTEPQLSQGHIERSVDSPIIFYKDEGNINFGSKFYKYGRLVTQVAVVMARADSNVHKEELNTIKQILWSIEGISSRERVFLLAKAKYLLVINRAYDERYQDYVRIALSKENTINKMESLSDAAKKNLLEIAKDIAIADGFLHHKELLFIKEMYRVIGLSVRSAKTDIEEHARKKFITLEQESHQVSDLFEGAAFEEIDDVLGDLLADFGDF
jgi:tellurite resistance protein